MTQQQTDTHFPQGALGARRLAPRQVPDIDLGPLYGDDLAARRRVIERLRRACTEVGFFYAYNGNVTADHIARVYAQSARFHALPDNADKRRLHKENSPYKRGWVPLHEEPAYEPGTVSYCASFDLARELSPQPVRAAYGNLGPNVWPELEGFRADVYGYYLACTQMGQILFRAFAEMLNLAPDFFTARSTERAPSTMRLLHYPANDDGGMGKNNQKNLGISAHTDFECFTIMHQTAPGLQLMTVQNQWVEAPARDDRFVVIIGDMLERWTNGWLKATRHRVINTPWERYSLILFCAADQDIIVEPLAQFIAPDNPPRYPPVTQLRHLSGEVETAMDNLQRAG